MDITDIQSEILARFEQSPVVVWDDPDGEFEDALAGLDLPVGIHILCERDGERFELKHIINGLSSDGRVLLYRREMGSAGSDWFADVVAYAQAFSADIVDSQLRALNAADTPEMRAALRSFAPFLRRKASMARVAHLRAAFAGPRELACAVMAAALGKGIPADADRIIVAYLMAALNEKHGGKAPWELLSAAGALDAFGDMVRSCTGFTGDVTDGVALARHILVSTLGASDSLVQSSAAGVDTVRADRCLEIAREWGRMSDADPDAHRVLLRLAEDVEESCGLAGGLSGLPMMNLVSIPMFPSIDEAIIVQLLHALEGGEDCFDAVIPVIDARRQSPWYADFEPFYSCVRSAAGIVRFQREEHAGFFRASASQVFEGYTNRWFEMDSYYRGFHEAFAHAISLGRDPMDGVLRRVADRVENVYKNWYLGRLSEAWIKASEGDLSLQGYVSGVPRQLDFYLSEVDGLARGRSRAWVIVSDALRYEVAAELSRVLEGATKGKTSLKAVQAVFPSITKCGMAALLPHSVYRLTADASGKAVVPMVDGSMARNRAERQAAIQTYLDANQPGARGVALKADDFVKMSQPQRIEAVRDAAVVYLYHDQIDAIGDKAATEDEVFKACGDAVSELTSLVSLLAGKFSAADVLITADHGFLYTYRPLDAADKVGKAEVSGKVIETGRRYAIAEKGASSDVMVRVDMGKVSDGELVGLAPRACVRIMQAGGGENYVHGGLSLQEMCVPVLHFKNSRVGSKGYVATNPAKLELVSSMDAIHNRSFTVDLLQGEPVGGKVVAAVYEVFLQGPCSVELSDVVRVVADRAEQDASKRMFHLRLHVKSAALSAGFTDCELVAWRIDDAGARQGGPEALRELRLEIAFADYGDAGW